MHFNYFHQQFLENKRQSFRDSDNDLQKIPQVNLGKRSYQDFGVA